ncbi:COG2426 family protein [Desulfurococcus amylolyticus]|uniref:Small multi-drug export protein n=1 Tax=Desulfurococcus amylolyticus DSM 16532 TaxID=768672 RepID=I3XRP4_DESAM|nr:small multi-drug export protein [Desulfurococcus amylolyticus]AFL66618.1 small multi-drug export protein [Desulfurococcus amylolyticus DSM 16532]
MNTTIVFWTIILGLAPVSEVRGAIPFFLVASKGDVYSLVYGFLIATLSNMCVPFIAFPLLDLLDNLVKKPWIPLLVKRAYGYLRKLGERKALSIKRSSYIALMVFVAIPLPVTGAWTGSLVAYILGLDRRRSIVAINTGVLVASVIVFASAYLGIELLRRIFML